MHGPMGGPRRMMEQETSKPKRTGATLVRLAQYFRPYTLVVIPAAILIVASTWTQVTAPQLIGQAVDCYLMPAATERLTAGAPAGMSFLQGGGSAGAGTNCTYTTVDPNATPEGKNA